MKRQATQYQPALLPDMPRPEFGGVQLRPGMQAQRPYSGPQPLFDTWEEDAPSFLDHDSSGLFFEPEED